MTLSKPCRSALAIGLATSFSVFAAAICHIQQPYMSLVLASTLSLLPRTSFKQLLYRLAALTMGISGAIILLIAFPEEPWFYIPLLSIGAASGYAFILKREGPGTAAAFSFFLLATHITCISSGFHTDVIVTGVTLWVQAFLSIVIAHTIACFLFESQKTLAYPTLPLSSIITMAIVVAIAALFDASIRADQGARLIMGTISTIAALEIAQSAADFFMKLGGYLLGVLISLVFILLITAIGNDISFYLLLLGSTFGLLEWKASQNLSHAPLYRATSSMLAFLVLLLPAPVTSLQVFYHRMGMTFIGFFIALLAFMIKREILSKKKQFS